MIVKCNLHQSAPRLTEYLINQAGNERVEIVANSGTIFQFLTPDDCRNASKIMDNQFQRTAGKYPCYHVQISPGKGEPLTPDQVPQAIETYLTGRNLTGRSHIATVHYKDDGSMHIHLQISRFNPKTQKLDPNKMWRDEHDAIRAKMEDQFGHARTPQRNQDRKFIKQAVGPLRDLPPGQFIEQVNRLGYFVAKGGNRNHPWRLIDGKNIDHDLSRISGLKAKELYEKFNGFTLPTFEDARKLMAQRISDRKLQEAVAEKEAKKAEQFDYSPDERPKVEVVQLDMEKKTEAALAAINKFRAEEKLREAQQALDELFDRPRKNRLRM